MFHFKNHCQSVFETLAVVAYLFSAFGLLQLVVGLMIFLSVYSRIGLLVSLFYCAWIYLDRNTNETGGRRSEWFRNLAWWRFHRSYFPVHLHKTAELPADKNYLLAAIPHGVLSAGAYSAFGTNASPFAKMFPGVKPYLCTLRLMFFLPAVRELMIMAGLISPTVKSLNNVLGGPGEGKAVVLVVGGASEALQNRPGTYKTILPQRKGFCRVALTNRVPLVPVVVFGEVDVYEVTVPVAGSRWDQLQQWVKNVTGVLPVRFYGEGFLGLLPKRKPINVVVGSPIEVESSGVISNEEVDKLHAKFTESVTALFEAEKAKYLSNPDVRLELIQ